MDVNHILIKLKKDIKDKSYDYVPTGKNKTSRRKFGLTMFDIEDFLMSLEKEDLIKGPVEDYDYPGEEVFIFKREILTGIVFYVKIKVKDGQVKILSCHEDECL